MTGAVHLEAASGDDARGDGNFGVWQDEPVKLEPEPTFARETAGIFVVAKPPGEVTASREGGVAEFAKLPEVADDGLADGGGPGGEVRFFQAAGEEFACAESEFLRGRRGDGSKENPDDKAYADSVHADLRWPIPLFFSLHLRVGECKKLRSGAFSDAVYLLVKRILAK
jgi:hypothetical protein